MKRGLSLLAALAYLASTVIGAPHFLIVHALHRFSTLVEPVVAPEGRLILARHFSFWCDLNVRVGREPPCGPTGQENKVLAPLRG